MINSKFLSKFLFGTNGSRRQDTDTPKSKIIWGVEFHCVLMLRLKLLDTGIWDNAMLIQ